MRKIIFTIAVLMLAFTATGQEYGSFLTVSGGLGGGGFQYTPKGLKLDGVSKDKLGWNASIGYSYYFDRHWGIATSVGVSYYRTVGKFNENFNRDTNYYALGYHVDDDQMNPNPNMKNYQLRLRTKKWEEEQKAYFIEIPLMAMFQDKFGETQRHGIYAGLGVKFQIPIVSTYRVLNGKNEEDLRLNISGRYYNDPTLDWGAPDPNNAEILQTPHSAHGFGTIHDPGSALNWKGDVSLKMSIAAVAEFGFLFGLTKRVDLTVGGYFEYGFNNIKKGTNKEFLQAPDQYLPNANNNLGAGITYNGMINTDVTKKVNLMAYGAKIGLRIKLGKLHEEEVPEQILPEPVFEDNSDLDSLEQQLEEMRKLLEELFALPDDPEPEPEIIELPPVEELPNILIDGIILDAKMRFPLSAVVEITDIKTKKLVAITRTDSITGNYKFALENSGSYILDVRKEGYLYYSEPFIVPTLNEKQVIDQLVLLNKIEVNQIIILENIFFDTGKSTLKPESMAEINNVYKLMIDNPSMEIEISGHTDNVGSEALNKKLSLARANVVVQVLIKNGISPSRLTSAGYGYDYPIMPNTTAEGRAKNRRTEFKVIKM
jgi:outer membrane protein OmpA-like peptidoglycan-associated protein